MKINPPNYNPGFDWSNRRSFDEAVIKADRERSSDDSAAVVSISLEALLAKAASQPTQEPGPSRTTSGMYCNYIRSWYHEVFAEAHKNGISFEEAMKMYGKEIAEFVVGENMKREALYAGKFPDKYPEGREQEFLDELKAFLDGATRRINGESLKDAFEGYDIEKAMEKFGPAMDIFFMNRHEYFDKDSNSTIVGYWSDRYEKYVYPPKPEQSEEINENVPQKEDSINVSPQDKSAIRNAIFKNSAEQMIASFHKKGNEIANGYINYEKVR
ncbi:MAG: hypothetical protein LBC75_01575 [Fibromonadaceae bacterium]|jgi:hypothetical protein|nr:hypothetical protein [Fibromonadaceae bacterium]